jgi:molybdate transport system substrate-binding protein
LFLSAVFVAPALAASVQVVSPPLVRAGLTQLAADYTKQTGIVVTVRADVMGKIMNDIKAGPTDVVLLPPNLMDVLSKDDGIKPGTRQTAGRVEIALAVRPGAPHPDISTVEKLRATLLSAKTVAYSQPGPPRNSMEAGIIDRILHRPEFAGVHTLTVNPGSGISALAKGDADMALQVVPEITPVKGVELVGPLPSELGAHIDVDTAISASSADPAAAEAFIRYIIRPDAAAEWKTFGLDR